MANHGTPSPIGELVRNAGAALTPETQIAVVDFQEPNAVWESRRVSAGYMKFIYPFEIAATLDQPGPQAVILPTAGWNKIGSYAPRHHDEGTNRSRRCRLSIPRNFPRPGPFIRHVA